MNLTAKIKDENVDKFINTIENRFKKVIHKSESKDVIAKMLEVMDNKQKMKSRGNNMLQSLQSSP